MLSMAPCSAFRAAAWSECLTVNVLDITVAPMSIFRKFRAETGWTQAQLAAAIEVQRSAIANYEAGAPPRRDVAQRFIALAKKHGQDFTLEDVFREPEAAA